MAKLNGFCPIYRDNCRDDCMIYDNAASQCAIFVAAGSLENVEARLGDAVELLKHIRTEAK